MENADILSDHFSVEGHKYIYQALIYLFSKKIKASPLAIYEILPSGEAKDAVEELDGLAYLSLLAEMDEPTSNLPIFIEKIKQSYTRRQLIKISKETMEFALSNDAEVLNPSELIHKVEERLRDVQANSAQGEEVYKMGTNAEEVLKKRAETPSVVPGLEVGMETYDKWTNGAQAGDLIVVCAESKTGKSVLLTNWATKLSVVDQLPVIYIDTEMNEREQEDRILANLSGVPMEEVVNGMFCLDTVHGDAVDKIERIKKAREMLNMGNYFHLYMPHFTIDKVNAIVRRMQLQFEIKVLFFDYIKVPSSGANFRNTQEHQALRFFTSGLKDLAGTLKIPVFTACQANRDDIGGGTRDARNIGGSYGILQLATKLMFLYNKTEEMIARDGIINGNQHLQIKYQRNGMSDCDPINIMFDRPLLRQTEV